MKAYQVFENKNHEGNFYKEWELPAGFPIPMDFVLIPPPVEFKKPKYNREKSIWEESREDIIVELSEKNNELKIKLTKLKQANEEMKQRAELVEEAVLMILDTQLQNLNLVE